MFIETPASSRLIGSPHVEHDIAGISVDRRARWRWQVPQRASPSVGTQDLCEAEHDGVPMPEHSPIVVNKRLIFVTEISIAQWRMAIV
ncbi:hypothetical protein [Chelativorans xinjiangense]|uniref:hypothetical protein n=1 Tax=Chelativorans xinjiangense TaxID=2681485 RepID=UPI001358A1C9|nr:hypothetical protein [Chelativorans xinjiangense]